MAQRWCPSPRAFLNGIYFISIATPSEPINSWMQQCELSAFRSLKLHICNSKSHWLCGCACPRSLLGIKVLTMKSKLSSGRKAFLCSNFGAKYEWENGAQGVSPQCENVADARGKLEKGLPNGILFQCRWWNDIFRSHKDLAAHCAFGGVK